MVSIDELETSEVSGGKDNEISLWKKCVCFPARALSYTVSSNIAGFVLGIYEGFGDVWTECASA